MPSPVDTSVFDDASVIEDLRHIANARMVKPETCMIATDSGRWAGRAGVYEESGPVLVIHTFLGPNMRGDNYG